MITDFSKGWRMYELKIAFNMQSQYSMRFYELIANKTKKISYKMSDIIKMFSLENTYLRTGTKKHNYALIELRVIKRHKRNWIECRPILLPINFQRIMPF